MAAKKKPVAKARIAKPKSGIDETAREVRDILDLSYEYARPYFDRANMDVELYEQIIDTATWQTMSEMTLGQAYRLVQNTLTSLLLNVLWASDAKFSLIPANVRDIGENAMDIARSVRDFTVHQLRDRMRIDTRGYNTVLDGVKIGNGYGIIEPIVIHTLERAETTLELGGKAKTDFSMQVSEPKTVLSYRYLPFGSVLPTPDGQYPDEVTAITVIDSMDEFTLRQLYDSKDARLKENPEEIIAYAKKNQYDMGTYNVRGIIEKLTGKTGDHAVRFGALRRKAKGITIVPIVKQFKKDKHVWIACDRFVMYETGRTVETLQSPIVNYKFSPEGNNWFNRGVISPNRDLMRNTEVWYNAMMDLFSLHLHPHQVINIESQAEDQPAEDLQPYSRTYVRGDPRLAQVFVAPPQLPPAVSDLGSRLQMISDDVAGLNTPQGGMLSPGIMRGGTQAIETVLQSSTDREQILAHHLQNTWFRPLIEMVLIYSTIYCKDEEEFVVLQTAEGAGQGRKAGDKYFKTVKITRSDLAYNWKVNIDFQERLRNSLAESAHRLQIYDRFSQDPEINTKELKRYVVGDEVSANKLMSGVSKVDRMQELAQMSQLGLLGGRGGGAGAGGQSGMMSPNAPGGNLGGGGRGLA